MLIFVVVSFYINRVKLSSGKHKKHNSLVLTSYHDFSIEVLMIIMVSTLSLTHYDRILILLSQCSMF